MVVLRPDTICIAGHSFNYLEKAGEGSISCRGRFWPFQELLQKIDSLFLQGHHVALAVDF